jgi:hypothetical protein
MIAVKRFRPASGHGWFYEGECPRCAYISLTQVTEADAVRRTNAHIGWWHDHLGN